jgi:uncharacterized protein
VPAALKGQLQERGVGIEVMTTASAASTYNLLMGEGRRVAALLVAVP